MTIGKLTGRSNGRLACLGAALALIAATPALAHHSYGAFSMDQEVEFKGTVKRWLFTNPHSLLVLSVQDKDGQEVDAPFEANGPGYLVRAGWHRETVKPGEEITVVAHPLRNGNPGGDIVAVIFPNGERLGVRPLKKAE